MIGLGRLAISMIYLLSCVVGIDLGVHCNKCRVWQERVLYVLYGVQYNTIHIEPSENTYTHVVTNSTFINWPTDYRTYDIPLPI